MKQAKPRGCRAFTMIEFIVVVFCVVVLVVAAILARPPHGPVPQKITCVNNLKQIGLGYLTWAGDNNDIYPAEASVADGGLYESLANTNQGAICWKIYDAMRNELEMASRVLICPSDVRKAYPEGNLTNSVFLNSNINLSYFAGIGAGNSRPSSLLGGDRNLGPGLVSSNDYGYSPNGGMGNDVTLSTNPAVSPICWSRKMESKGSQAGTGNLLFGDASVQTVGNALLGVKVQPAAGAPFVKGSATNAPASGTFRLLFP